MPIYYIYIYNPKYGIEAKRIVKSGQRTCKFQQVGTWYTPTRLLLREITADTAATPSAASTRDFLWALGVILSRAVQEEGAGGAGLVPYLDFANHGDRIVSVNGGARLGGGQEEVASCERGFDPATGSHFLRALRDVLPGAQSICCIVPTP